METLLSAPQPLIERLWQHEVNAESLSTPEQKAGLRRRLLDHVATITDVDVREQYRAEFLRRFSALTTPARPPWQPGRAGRGGARFVPPPRPASPAAKAVGSGGLDPQLGRALLLGLLRFPALIADHAEALAGLALRDRASAALRDRLIESAAEHSRLDPEALLTILADKGASHLVEEVRRKRGLAFSFTRRDAEPDRSCRDLALVIETLAVRPGLDAALAAATARLKETGDEAAFQEQQRLRAARDEAEQRLGALLEAQAGEG